MTKYLYIPVARLTFHMESAEDMFAKSIALLKECIDDVIIPKKLLSSPDILLEFLEEHKGMYDAVIFQHITFTDGEFMKHVIDNTETPIILWGVREPSVNSRLKLNSLTGIMSSANVLNNHQRSFFNILGNPNEAVMKDKLIEIMTLVNTIHSLSTLNIGVVGEYPSGFYFSDADYHELFQAFKVSLKRFDLEMLFEAVDDVDQTKVEQEIEYAHERVNFFDKDSKQSVVFAKTVTAFKDLIDDHNLNALASRCWPDFFTEMEVAPCGIFSQLADQGYPVGCEADIHGTLSMYMLQQLAHQKQSYLGDIVHFDESLNTIVLWHCGFAPYSLANKKTGAVSGLHPNRQMGFALDNGLKTGEVTLFRVGRTPNGYRFIVTTGHVNDTENMFSGTSAEVTLDTDVMTFLSESIEKGFEPHFALVYGNVKESLKQLAKYYKIEIEEY